MARDRLQVAQSTYDYYTKPSVSTRVTGGNLKDNTVPRRNTVADFLGLVQQTKSVFDEADKIYNKQNKEKAVKAYLNGEERPEAEGFLNRGKGLETYNIMEGQDLAERVDKAVLAEFQVQNGFKDRITKVIDADGNEVFDATGVKEALDSLYTSTMNNVFGDKIKDPNIFLGASETLRATQMKLNALAADSNFAFGKETAVNGLMQKDLSTIDKYANMPTHSGASKSTLLKRALDANTDIFGKPNFEAGFLTRDEQTSNRIDVLGDYMKNTLIEEVENPDGTKTTRVDAQKISDVMAVYFEKGKGGISWYDIKDSKGNYKFRDKINRILSQTQQAMDNVDKNKAKTSIAARKENLSLLKIKIRNKEIGDKDIYSYLNEGYITPTDANELLDYHKMAQENSFVVKDESYNKAFSQAKTMVIRGDVTASEVVTDLALEEADAREIFTMEREREERLKSDPNYSRYLKYIEAKFLPEKIGMLRQDYPVEYREAIDFFHGEVLSGSSAKEAYNSTMLKYNKGVDANKIINTPKKLEAVLGSRKVVNNKVTYTITSEDGKEAFPLSKEEFGALIIETLQDNKELNNPDEDLLILLDEVRETMETSEDSVSLDAARLIRNYSIK